MQLNNLKHILFFSFPLLDLFSDELNYRYWVSRLPSSFSHMEFLFDFVILYVNAIIFHSSGYFCFCFYICYIAVTSSWLALGQENQRSNNLFKMTNWTVYNFWVSLSLPNKIKIPIIAANWEPPSFQEQHVTWHCRGEMKTECFFFQRAERQDGSPCDPDVPTPSLLLGMWILQVFCRRKREKVSPRYAAVTNNNLEKGWGMKAERRQIVWIQRILRSFFFFFGPLCQFTFHNVVS